MAGKGAPPSGSRARANDQRRDDAQVVELEDDGVLRGPELPEVDVDLGPEVLGVGWPAQTSRWWDSWRRSPQAVTFTDTDWDFLADTALLHAAMWRGDMKAASEVRLRVAAFGATPADRARLRMSIKSPGASGADAGRRTERTEDRAAAAAASSRSKRKGRILNLVSDGEAEGTG